MIRLVCGLMLVLFILVPSFAQQPLVGTYKFITQIRVLDGLPAENMGKAPKGYLVLTPTRAVLFFTAENRKFGTAEADKAALLDSLVAWAGPYKVEGNKLTVRVNASWTEMWNGKDMVRTWELSGNRLTLTSGSEPYARDPSKMVTVKTVWEKIE